LTVQDWFRLIIKVEVLPSAFCFSLAVLIQQVGYHKIKLEYGILTVSSFIPQKVSAIPFILSTLYNYII
jgi:hypothetical protein